MLVAYLPTERILIEADLFDSKGAGVPPQAPPQARATPANRSLLGHIRRLGLDVETIVPIHGLPVAWSDFTRLVESGR
jgi:hypothetical protein